MGRTMRFTKDRSRVYEITCPRGRDPETGKRLSPYSMRWDVPKGYSDKKADKEAAKIEAQFISDCNAGKIKTKKEQKSEALKAAQQAALDRLEYEKNLTFDQYKDIYISKRSAKLSPQTILNYEFELGYASKDFGKIKMVDITRTMIKKNIEERPGKVSSLRVYDTILRRFFKFAVEDEVIPVSPMDHLDRPELTREEKGKEVKAFSEDEAREILKCADQEPLMYRALIYLALDTGMRIGELVALKRENVDFETGKITVCASGQFSKHQGGKYESSTKSGRSRVIILNLPALQALKDWDREQRMQVFETGKTNMVYFFEGKDGGSARKTKFQYYLKTFGQKYGFEDFHPHKLRHTMATIMIGNGAPISAVSYKLGHANISITLNIYAHVYEEANVRANEIYANALYGNRNQYSVV